MRIRLHRVAPWPAACLTTVLLGLCNVTQAAYLVPAVAAHEVDRLLTTETLADSGASIASMSDDETFLRRLSLDLVGELPTPGEITAFAQ